MEGQWSKGYAKGSYHETNVLTSLVCEYKPLEHIGPADKSPDCHCGCCCKRLWTPELENRQGAGMQGGRVCEIPACWPEGTVSRAGKMDLPHSDFWNPYECTEWMARTSHPQLAPQDSLGNAVLGCPISPNERRVEWRWRGQLPRMLQGNILGTREALGAQESETHTDESPTQEHPAVSKRANKPSLNPACLPRCRAWKSTTAWSKKMFFARWVEDIEH